MSYAIDNEDFFTQYRKARKLELGKKYDPVAFGEVQSILADIPTPPWPKPETYEGPKYYNPNSGEWTTGGLKWNGGYAVKFPSMTPATEPIIPVKDFSLNICNNLSVTPPTLGPGEEVRIKSNGRTVQLRYYQDFGFNPATSGIGFVDHVEPKLHYTLPPRISTRRKHAGQIAFALMLACWVLYVVFTFGR